MSNRSTGLRRWFEDHPLRWGLILVGIFAFLRFFQTLTWKNWFGSLDFPTSPQFALFLLAWFIILAIGLIVVGINRLTRTSWQSLGWSRRGLLKAIGLSLLGFILLYLNIILWSLIRGSTQQPEIIVPSTVRLLLVAFFAFGQPAWVEENLYRGFLQPLLLKRMNIWPAILIQAAIFSLAHIGYLNNLYDFGSSFVAGLILGWLRGREGNIAAPFLAHGLFWMMAAFMPAIQ